MSPSWSPISRTIVTIFSLIILALFLYLARPLLGPLLVAILLAYLLEPVVAFVDKRTPIPYKGAVVLVFFLFVAILITAISTLIPALIREALTLSIDLTDIETQIESYLVDSITILGREIQLDKQFISTYLNQAIASLTPALEDAFQVLEFTSTGLIWTLIVFVSSFYFLLDGDDLAQWLIHLAPEAHQSELNHLLQEINTIWQAYVRGTLVLMLIIGVVFTIVLAGIGLPGALTVGILTGLLIVLPELGPLLAGILATIIAFFQGSEFIPLTNTWFAVLVAAIYLVLMQVRAIWLQPRLIGRFLHMHPGIVFVAIISTLILQGALATLFIVPILATVGILARYLRCKLLDIDPWPGDTVPALSSTLMRDSKEAANQAWLERLKQESEQLAQRVLPGEGD